MIESRTISLLVLLIPSTTVTVTSWSLTSSSRRDFAQILLGQSSWLLQCALAPATTIPPSLQQDDAPEKSSPLLNYRYNNEWKGTSLTRLTQSAAANYPSDVYTMGQWPDPMLRYPASQVVMGDTASHWNSDELKRIAQKLTQTARTNGAVGLAAQQCGVDVSMVFLDYVSKKEKALVMINPRIIERSPELDMQVWTEQCLVLPPSFTATLLRDAKITVQYQDFEGRPKSINLEGELARAAQHEMDHDSGILIVDHVALDELESEDMRRIERFGHEDRMKVAYARSIEQPVTAGGSSNSRVIFSGSGETNEVIDLVQQVKEWMVPVARADEPGATINQSVATTCNDSCQAERRQLLENRRQLMRQSRSNTQRSDVLELSRQRAALYNTTYQGVTCAPGVPCL